MDLFILIDQSIRDFLTYLSDQTTCSVWLMFFSLFALLVMWLVKELEEVGFCVHFITTVLFFASLTDFHLITRVLFFFLFYVVLLFFVFWVNLVRERFKSE